MEVLSSSLSPPLPLYLLPRDFRFLVSAGGVDNVDTHFIMLQRDHAPVFANDVPDERAEHAAGIAPFAATVSQASKLSPAIFPNAQMHCCRSS